MSRPRLSAPASALVRVLLRRSNLRADRILLTHCLSTEWRSLTFAGERHQLGFRITGDDALAQASALVDGIEEADLPIGGGGFVADIAHTGALVPQDDGSVLVELEALTLED